MLAYPTSLPTDALDDLISQIEHATILSNSQQVGLDAWNLQGYLQSVVIGSPASPASHADAIAALKALRTAGSTSSLTTIDWGAILQWILTLIESLLQGALPAGM